MDMTYHKKFWAFVFSSAFASLCGVMYVRYWQQKDAQPIPCRSCIIESTTVNDVLYHTSERDTLFVFDIDNTLVRPETDLGSDQWFACQIKRKRSTGMSFEQACDEVVPVYSIIQENIGLKPVEPETAGVIETLEKRGFAVMALTARSQPIIERTLAQLRDAGITLHVPPALDVTISCTLERPLEVRSGIIFAGRNNKGCALLHVLQMCHRLPRAVVFVDDKVTSLLDVEKECLANNIRFIGIRYGNLDERVSHFDPACAETQLASLLVAKGSTVSCASS